MAIACFPALPSPKSCKPLPQQRSNQGLVHLACVAVRAWMKWSTTQSAGPPVRSSIQSKNSSRREQHHPSMSSNRIRHLGGISTDYLWRVSAISTTLPPQSILQDPVLLREIPHQLPRMWLIL